MRGVFALNAILLATGLLASVSLTAAVSGSEQTKRALGSNAVEDATGTRIPVRSYARIASTSTVADQVLVELVEPGRLLAVSKHTLRSQISPEYDDKIGVERPRDIETLIELRPDIVFVNDFVDRRHVERLEDAGLTVFDLGAMRGRQTLVPNVRRIAAVLGVSGRGEQLVRRLESELDGIATGVRDEERQRALYVGIHGDRLYGGTAGTSFHDVLSAAGLVDVAAEAGYEGWPAYTSEQLLSLDPPWIITNPGTEDMLCGHPGLSALSACRNEQVRSVETSLLTDPGLRMVEAARAVHAEVYGEDR